ncbi:MAG: DUF2293 domain-containing protein [Desulforhopalus sp.]
MSQIYGAEESRTVKPTSSERTVIAESGEQLTVPAGWDLLPPGDGPLTRLVKAKGPTWLVQVKKGRRFISQGIWANAENIEAARCEITAKRSKPDYARRRMQDAARREKKHQEYVRTFYGEVLHFLDFHPRYSAQAETLARLVTELSTPIGSGTVARTERIPINERAARAVIAWLRHQTTNYDRMTIAKVKGERREVRRALAARSADLLRVYREGGDVDPSCPLSLALKENG